MLSDLHEMDKGQLNLKAQASAEIRDLRGQLVEAGLGERQIDHFLQRAAKKKDRPASQLAAAAKQKDPDATKPLASGQSWADVLSDRPSSSTSNKPVAVVMPTRPKPKEEKLCCRHYFLNGRCAKGNQCDYSHEWCDSFLYSKTFNDWVGDSKPLPTHTQRFVQEAEQSKNGTESKAKLARDSKAAPESYVVIGNARDAESDTSEQKDVPMSEPQGS